MSGNGAIAQRGRSLISEIALLIFAVLVVESVVDPRGIVGFGTSDKPPIDSPITVY